MFTCAAWTGRDARLPDAHAIRLPAQHGRGWGCELTTETPLLLCPSSGRLCPAPAPSVSPVTLRTGRRGCACPSGAAHEAWRLPLSRNTSLRERPAPCRKPRDPATATLQGHAWVLRSGTPSGPQGSDVVLDPRASPPPSDLHQLPEAPGTHPLPDLREIRMCNEVGVVLTLPAQPVGLQEGIAWTGPLGHLQSPCSSDTEHSQG